MTHPGKGERTPAFVALAAAVLPAMAAMADIRLHRADHVPAEGAFVLAPNHHSEIDPLVMGVALWKAGRVPRFLAKESLFRVPVLGQVLRATGQIPVDRAGAVRGADPTVAARALADRDLAVVIYPEGSLTRDPDLWPMRGKAGAVRTALAAGVPIVPVAHWGAQRLMPRYGGLRPIPRKRIDVVFGEPIDLAAYRGRPMTQALLQEATDEVMAAITGLLAGLRDEPAPATRWDPSRQGQAETGRFDG